jgi:hypothetical protein
MKRIQVQLICLAFLETYVVMTGVIPVTAGEYLMGTISECEARLLYMIKARLLSSPSVDHTHHRATLLLVLLNYFAVFVGLFLIKFIVY